MKKKCSQGPVPETTFFFFFIFTWPVLACYTNRPFCNHYILEVCNVKTVATYNGVVDPMLYELRDCETNCGKESFRCTWLSYVELGAFGVVLWDLVWSW